jgi:hypothetical protein
LNIFKRQLKFARTLIVNCFFGLMRLSFQRDSQYFYGRYMGTDHKFVLVIKNLIRPKRIIKKFIYGQIFRIPFIFSAGNRTEGLPELPSEWQKYIDILKRDGIVIIPSFYNKEAKTINEYFKLNGDEFPPNDEYYRLSADINNPNVFNIAVDPMILTILAKYYNCQPYHRTQPSILCTHLDVKKESEKNGFNDFWHYDTVNQMTAHILLNDISESDNCMFYAKGSHRTHREYISINDYYYSEEYMNNNFDIIPCVGESGSLVIFDPNGLHRLDQKVKTFRSHMLFLFTPGNDLMTESKYIHADFNSNTRDEFFKLDQYQARSLSNIVKK